MHKAQRAVAQFHRVLGVTVGTTPGIRDAGLRAALIREEAAEAVAAIESGNLVEAIDGLCDLLYVVYGAAVSFGVDLEPFFDEVHRSNMTKLAGPRRADGKVLKGDAWQPPRIRELLSAAGEGRLG
jgi:predicted HAD superfamily Cof-like phosphohydrolase